MSKPGAPRYEVQVLEELLSNYIEDGSEKSRLKLINRIIDGEDLVEALEIVDDFYSERHERAFEVIRKARVQTQDVRGIYNEIRKDLEILIEGKEGPFIDKIKNILEED